MDSSETCRLDHQSSDAVISSEEIPDHFVCCVCLDLLHKPIVLSCGHISCFWCVHKSMKSRESHCPICRNPYSHFPGICQMLHFLLLKLYPITYKKREAQILEEEKRTGFFSPEFHCHACESEGEEINHLGSSSKSQAISESPSTGKEKLGKTVGQIDSRASGEENNPISVADFLCTACEQLLFRPIVLNCGHVYCQNCIIFPAEEKLRCQACQCVHPRGPPKVCLTLDQFLAAKFSKEYELRKDDVQLKQDSFKLERPTTCSAEAGKQDISPVQLPSGVRPHTHIGVGCDVCGMYPIVGDRYRCKDCTEKIGFDLCGDCYETRAKLPGRFNQRHTPDHKFQHIKHHIILQSLRMRDGSTSIVVIDEASENLENGVVTRSISGGGYVEDFDNNLASSFLEVDNIEYEDEDDDDDDEDNATPVTD